MKMWAHIHKRQTKIKKKKRSKNIIDDVIIINESLIMVCLLEITYHLRLFGSNIIYSL